MATPWWMIISALEPVLPELPEETPCPKARESWTSRTAVTNTSVFGRIALLPLGANGRYCHPFLAATTQLQCRLISK